MPPRKPPFIKTPTPLRPNPWRDGEDPIPGIGPKPKSKPPPPKDGDPIDPQHDHAEPCHACAAEEE